MPSITPALKFILLRGLKNGDAKISLIMLSLPKNIGRKMQVSEIMKRYVANPLNIALNHVGHFP
jgi:hypothetical protein